MGILYTILVVLSFFGTVFRTYILKSLQSQSVNNTKKLISKDIGLVPSGAPWHFLLNSSPSLMFSAAKFEVGVGRETRLESAQLSYPTNPANAGLVLERGLVN